MDTEIRSHYELLGVERSASDTQIKLAYRDIARVYHPDANHDGRPAATILSTADHTRFKMITEAYNTLLDKQKRQQYDLELTPELASWDKNTDRRFRVQRTGKTSAYAFGTFGNLEGDSLKKVKEEKTSESLSMSEIISNQKKSKVRRMLAILGL